MGVCKLVALMLISFQSVAAAQAIDWSAQLTRPTIDLIATIGPIGKCVTTAHSVPVAFVDNETATAPDLLEPISNKGYQVALIDPADLSVDRDMDRRYVANGIVKLTCTIGREATATGYSFDNKIFRIHLDFDRCETREEEAVSALSTPDKPFVISRCRGVDVREKDFDAVLYKSIKARNTFGYTKQGQPRFFDLQWTRFTTGEFEPSERRYVARLGCSGSGELERVVARSSYKCLIDIINADAMHWSATAMYELFDRPIGIWSNAGLHLTSKRIFVDIPAEQRAVESMLPGLRVMVDDVRRKIALRVGARESRDNSVSNILGAGDR